MKRVIAFAGSNSKNSINKKLATFAAHKIEDVDIKILDLNDYELPIYGIDHENEKGIPSNAQDFLKEIKDSDGIILSLAEHNGAYSAAFKNIFDWMSRIDGKLWSDKPMLLMATAPGGRGGASVLEIAGGKFPRMSAQIASVFSLPFFNDNFSEDRITDHTLKESFEKAIQAFQIALVK